MIITKLIDCKDETITLTMERKLFSRKVLFKLNDKVIGYSRNKAINKILFNDMPMAFFEWYCLMILINYHLFSVEDINVGDLFIDIPDDNILKVHNCDELDELTIKYIPEYKDHLKNQLKPELMVYGFYQTVDHPFLNSLFKEEDIIQNSKFTYKKYLNSSIINYYLYNQSTNLLINSDLIDLNKRKELCMFSVELNRHITKCTDVLIKESKQ